MLNKQLRLLAAQIIMELALKDAAVRTTPNAEATAAEAVQCIRRGSYLPGTVNECITVIDRVVSFFHPGYDAGPNTTNHPMYVRALFTASPERSAILTRHLNG